MMRLVAGLVLMALVSLGAGRWWALSLVPVVVVWAARTRARALPMPAPVPEQGPRDVPELLRSMILERDGGACRYHAEAGVNLPVHREAKCPHRDPRTGVPLGCGACFEADHVVPYSRGGPTIVGNLLTSCRRCNRAKSDRPVLDFLANPGFDWQQVA